jgi:hypothetical protein
MIHKWKVVALSLPAAFLVACTDQPTAPVEETHGVTANMASHVDLGHVVVGYAWNDYGYGHWSHTFDVVQGPRGKILGSARVSLYEPATADYAGLKVNYTNDIDCLEIDEATKSVWLGGHITRSDNPAFLPVGTYVIDFAHDGGPGGAHDTHGDYVPSWSGTEDTCHHRDGPWFADAAQRGNLLVR